jgi:hypothetical protein
MAIKATWITAALVASVGVATTAAGEVALEVGDVIALEAEDATLREVLLEIGEAVPLTLVERGAAPDQPVSLTLEAATWPGLFRKLLGRESHLLTLDGETGTPRRLVVRWDAVGDARVGTAAAGAATGRATDAESRIRAAAGGVLAPPDAAGEAIARMEDARDAFEAARGGPNAAEAREAYLDAMSDLDSRDEPRAVEALVPALDMDDRDARLASLESLRWLSETARNRDAVDAAMSAFETAEDDAVERAALEVLVRYGDQQKVMRMLEPLALSDGPNRDIAVREWIRIRDEQVAQKASARGGDRQLRKGQ